MKWPVTVHSMSPSQSNIIMCSPSTNLGIVSIQLGIQLLGRKLGSVTTSPSSSPSPSSKTSTAATLPPFAPFASFIPFTPFELGLPEPAPVKAPVWTAEIKRPNMLDKTILCSHMLKYPNNLRLLACYMLWPQAQFINVCQLSHVSSQSHNLPQTQEYRPAFRVHPHLNTTHLCVDCLLCVSPSETTCWTFIGRPENIE